MSHDEVQPPEDSAKDVLSQEEQWAREFMRGEKSMVGFDWLGERYREILESEGLPESRALELAQRLQADTQVLLQARKLADCYLGQIEVIDSRRAREEMYASNRDEPSDADSRALQVIARVRNKLGRQAAEGITSSEQRYHE